MLKKKDIILMVVVLMIAGVLAILMKAGQTRAGETICIMVDGEEYGTYSLAHNEVIEVKNKLGYNRIVVKDGVVFMEEADCPDQYCVDHVAITKTNETIVCLPHKLVVEVVAKTQETEIDGVVH